MIDPDGARDAIDLSADQIKDYPPAHWAAFANPRVGRFAMPMYMGTIVMYYNKDMFDAKGVPYPDGSWNWTVAGDGTFGSAAGTSQITRRRRLRECDK